MKLNVKDFLRKYTMIIALVIVFILFCGLTDGRLLYAQNMSNLMLQNGYVLVLACGMLLCILTGGNIDLSVGAVICMVGGLAAVLFTGFFGMGLQGIIYFLFLAVLTVVTFIDMDTMEIPFILNVIIFVMGVVSLILQFVSDAAPGSEFLAMDEVTIVSRLIGMICISLPLYLIVLIIPEGFGGGDIKLMFAAGFLLGWKATVVGFFIGLILGGIYGVICLVRRSHGKNDHFAFGPFLSVGLAITLFCGNDLMNRYIDFLKAAMNPEM